MCNRINTIDWSEQDRFAIGSVGANFVWPLNNDVVIIDNLDCKTN